MTWWILKGNEKIPAKNRKHAVTLFEITKMEMELGVGDFTVGQLSLCHQPRFSETWYAPRWYFRTTTGHTTERRSR